MFAERLLELCWKFAGSCKHPITLHTIRSVDRLPCCHRSQRLRICTGSVSISC